MKKGDPPQDPTRQLPVLDVVDRSRRREARTVLAYDSEPPAHDKKHNEAGAMLDAENELRVSDDLAADLRAFFGVRVASRLRSVLERIETLASGLELNRDHLVRPVGSFVVRSIFVGKQGAVDLLAVLVDCRRVGFVLAQTKCKTGGKVMIVNGSFLSQ